MATVPNRDGKGITAGGVVLSVDPPLSAPNRSTDSPPGGVLRPLYPGEIVVLSTDGTMYKAMSLSNTSWVRQ